MQQKGRSVAEVLAELDATRATEPDPHGARLFGLTYPSGREDLEQLAHEVYRRTLFSNALNPFRFPEQARLMEQVVTWTGELVDLPADGGGTTTSGGTESILMAVLVHRERAHARGVAAPTVVAPVTAHPAYAKAAHYLGLELVQVPVDPVTMRADPAAAARLVDARTALVVVSAYSYPHGVMDDVAALAALAQDRGAGCHVDACVGGMVLPFASRAGVRAPAPWTFAVPGVTSMSVDLHKYGYVPKGVSVVLHRDADWAQHQWFVYDRWPGGLYGAPGVAGARSAAPVLAAWAVMSHLGVAGYTEIVTDLLGTTDALRAGIESVDELAVNGDPVGTILSWRSTSESLDAYALGDALVGRGWYVNRVTDTGGVPPGLHVMVSPAHREVVADLSAAIRECADEVRGSSARADGPARYA